MYLVPIGSGRFELYTEPPDDTSADEREHEVGAPSARAGAAAWRRLWHRLHERWRHAEHAAQHAAPSTGRWGRARDRIVCRIAESIAEQRTLWSLRAVTAATLVFPDDLSHASSTAARAELLAHSRRHHLRWLIANLIGVTLTAVLVLVPGPNVVGYYFLFRVVGHFLAWRGARQGMERTLWRGRPEPALTALGALALRRRDERAADVERLAMELHLPRLAAFFDRVALPGR